MKLHVSIFLLALGCSLVMRGAETNTALTIEAPGGGLVEFQLKTGVATYKNGVVVKYGPTVLTADTVQIDRQSGETYAQGNVILQRETGQLWRGDRLTYNFKTRVISGQNFRAGQRPYFIGGEGLLTNPTNGSDMATNAFFTTDDHPEPNYRIQARQIIIIPGQSIEARDAVAYLGPVPVMYFPYFHRDLTRHPNNFEFLPGYRSLWGPFLLSSYNWYWNERLDGVVHLDLRGQRGVAGGPDFHWNDPTFGEGLFRYYYAHDEDPKQRPGYEKPGANRQRIYFGEQLNIRTNLTVRGVVSYQNDPSVVRDFFESEYQDDVQPKSFVEANQDWSNWNLNALTLFRVNDFQETVERLPDVKLTGLRQQIGPSPLYYESESSVGYFRHLFPNETNFFSPGLTNAFGATRADTYHQITLPWTFFGWLNVIPRVGQRVTYYSEADGRGTTTEEETRGVFNTGAEVTWKASRVYRQAESELLDTHGVRHIIEPSFNYVFVPSLNTHPRRLPQFDSQLPSSRLLPIDFPDYNSIDSIDNQQVVRLGLRNKFQTKRDGQIDNLLKWDVYTDWRITPYHGQETFSDIYSDLDFKPRSWITFNSELRLSVEQAALVEANHTLTLQPAQNWAVALSHRYLDDTPELGVGNNLISGTVFYQLNENWGARITEQFNARDGVLQYQFYTLYRDFRSWTGALTLRIREDTGQPNDYTVAFTFSLKAFPRYGVGKDAVRPTRLIGG